MITANFLIKKNKGDDFKLNPPSQYHVDFLEGVCSAPAGARVYQAFFGYGHVLDVVKVFQTREPNPNRSLRYLSCPLHGRPDHERRPGHAGLLGPALIFK